MQAERKRGRQWLEGTQGVCQRALVRGDRRWRARQGYNRDEIEYALLCVCVRVLANGMATRREREREREETPTQNACSAKKFGWRLHNHRPRVQKPRAASSWVHARRAPGHCARASYVPCFHAWNANCWLSAVNSNARSASAVRVRMRSGRVSGGLGLGCVAAISAGVASRNRKRFWIVAVDGVRACGVYVYMCVCGWVLSCGTYR